MHVDIEGATRIARIAALGECGLAAAGHHVEQAGRDTGGWSTFESSRGIPLGGHYW